MYAALPMDCSSFRESSPVPAWGPPWAVARVSVPGQSSLWPAEEYLLQPLEHFLSSFFSLLGVRRVVSHYFPRIYYYCVLFCSFFNLFS